MLRRAGVLYPSFYKIETTPFPNDNGDVLKTKWLKWVELESFKRYRREKTFWNTANHLKVGASRLDQRCTKCSGQHAKHNFLQH